MGGKIYKDFHYLRSANSRNWFTVTHRSGAFAFLNIQSRHCSKDMVENVQRLNVTCPRGNARVSIPQRCPNDNSAKAASGRRAHTKAAHELRIPMEHVGKICWLHDGPFRWLGSPCQYLISCRDSQGTTGQDAAPHKIRLQLQLI